MKQCAYCGNNYPDEATVCALEGEPLIALAARPEREGRSISSRSSENSDLHKAQSPPPVSQTKLTAQIKFETPGSFDQLNLRFRGKGSIEVGPHSIILSGKQCPTLWF